MVIRYLFNPLITPYSHSSDYHLKLLLALPLELTPHQTLDKDYTSQKISYCVVMKLIQGGWSRGKLLKRKNLAGDLGVKLLVV